MNPLDHFVTVPEVTFSNGHVEPSFQVGVYLCSKGRDGLVSVNEKDEPWTRVTMHDAKHACFKSGYSLMTYDQSMAISVNLSENPMNWTGGKVGLGGLYKGLHKGGTRKPVEGSYRSLDSEEERFFVLSNGGLICDAAGNAYQYADTTSDISVPMGTGALTPYKDMGCALDKMPVDSLVIRGGFFNSGPRGEGGLFQERSWGRSNCDEALGFRCVKLI